ncbi:MAG: hypothetical protein AAGA18_14805 [Verrucomicrobiota bacterium]
MKSVLSGILTTLSVISALIFSDIVVILIGAAIWASPAPWWAAILMMIILYPLWKLAGFFAPMFFAFLAKGLSEEKKS